MVQWTAGIRLAIFEYTTLQEAYTGALIAGKGKSLNSINIILARTTFKYEDWVRVRFGAGTPWRQCWCVVTPPDEKEVQKLQKVLNKKKSAYDRSRPPLLKGDVKFYDSRKITKKTKPVASISDAFSAFAIYPQSKPLIDASTLIKLEGNITIYSDPPTCTEGFVFVMPEVHAAVSGFEMMLRWLFPVFDTFGLYGRPGRLAADTLDTRSLMFAMPKERRYGYLEILDVAGLISAEGSQNWREAEWRLRLKDLTSKRMTAIAANGGSRRSSRRITRDSFNDRASTQSTPSVSWGPPPADVPGVFPRTDSAPPGTKGVQYPPSLQRLRSASDSLPNGSPVLNQSYAPAHGANHADSRLRNQYDGSVMPEEQYIDGEEAFASGAPVGELRGLHGSAGVVEPVSQPPAFAHAPGAVPPANKLQNSPELRRAKSRMSNATLSQLAGAGGIAAHEGVAQYKAGLEEARIAQEQNWQQREVRPEERGVHNAANADVGINANQNAIAEGLVANPSFHEFPSSSSDPRASGGISAFPLSNIPSNYHSDNQPEHAYASSTDSTGSQLHNPNRSSIQRKPLPTSAPRASEPLSPDTASTIGSFRIDQDGFDRVIPRDQNVDPQFQRQDSILSGVSSAYDDASSHGRSEYQTYQTYQAYQATELRNSYERPRSGMMRTVGGFGDREPPTSVKSDTFNIDFGPTINYAANPLIKDKSPTSLERSVDAPNIGPPPRQSIRKPAPEPQYRPGHQAKQASRTVAWQPGMAVPRSDSPSTSALTPEEFVQQRAAAATAPQYAHQRQGSSSTLRAGSPANQGPRPDYLSHTRNNSSLDAPQRPGSRGAGATLGGSGGDQTNLSAREREHLSKVTGNPLINLPPGPGYRGGSNSPTAGLLGSIDVREQEKRNLRQGLNNQAVQHAMNQRQVHGQQQYPPPQGQLPPLPPHGQQQQQQFPQQEYPGPFARPPFGSPQQQASYGGRGGQVPGSPTAQFPFPSPEIQDPGRAGWGQGGQQQRGHTPEPQLTYQERIQQQQQYYPTQQQGQGRGGRQYQG